MRKSEIITKLAEIVESSGIENDRLNELLGIKKEEEKSSCKVLVTILAVVGAVVAICAISYAVYQYFKPDYLDEFDEDFEDFDDLFEEDFFEDEASDETDPED